jgi:hypothetical protein
MEITETTMTTTLGHNARSNGIIENFGGTGTGACECYLMTSTTNGLVLYVESFSRTILQCTKASVVSPPPSSSTTECRHETLFLVF